MGDVVALNPVRLPGPDSRMAVVGSTGSGKTFAGVWHLSMTDWNTARPWFIIDFKRDKLLSKLGATLHKLGDKIPREPGLYIVQPMPTPEDEARMVDFLWQIWANENTGLYFDEGYMVGNRNPAFRALLTQGRSKLIQMIILSQRPVWMDRFVFSESDFFMLFRLNDRRDKDTVQSMISVQVKERLPEYHSLYYDVSRDSGNILGPVPNRAQLIETFHARKRKQWRVA
jgi:hypothetical protein